MPIGTMVLFLLVSLGSAFAGEDQHTEAEALFSRANGGFGFSTIGPYTVGGHLRVIFRKPLDGTFLKVASPEPDTWRSEIRFPGYSEVIVRNGDRQWIHRNLAFTPLQVQRLRSALQLHWKVNEKEKVEKVTDEMVGPTRAKCVKLKAKDRNRELCMDSIAGVPLREKDSWGRLEVDYEGYSSVVGNKQFPQLIRVTEAGRLVAELSVDSLSVDLPDKFLFNPLPDAVVWPACDESKIRPPVPISTPDPAYPESERRNRVQGVVVLQVLIDEQGNIHDAVVVSSLSKRLDEEAKAAVLRWRFQPAMCGSTPIPREMTLEMSFRLY